MDLIPWLVPYAIYTLALGFTPLTMLIVRALTKVPEDAQFNFIVFTILAASTLNNILLFSMTGGGPSVAFLLILGVVAMCVAILQYKKFSVESKPLVDTALVL